METWVLIAMLLYKHPVMAGAANAAVQVEFSSQSACQDALGKIKAEMGAQTGVTVSAVCVKK